MYFLDTQAPRTPTRTSHTHTAQGLLLSLVSDNVATKIYWYEWTERFAKWTMHDCACVVRAAPIDRSIDR